MKPDAQKVTNLNDSTCVFRFLGSRIFATSRVRSDYAALLDEVHLPPSHEPSAP